MGLHSENPYIHITFPTWIDWKHTHEMPTFHYLESKEKPFKGSAISTLKQIHSIFENRMHISQKNSLIGLDYEPLSEKLLKDALSIKTNYLRKTSKLSSIKRFFGRIDAKEKQIEKLYFDICAARQQILSPGPYVYIELHGKSFKIAKWHHKPLEIYPEGCALFTLKRIRYIFENQMNLRELDLTRTDEDLHVELLQQAESIGNNFFKKSSKLSSLRRFFGRVDKKERAIEDACLAIKNASAKKTLDPSKFPPELFDKICSYLGLKDIGSLKLSNNSMKTLCNDVLYFRVKRLGYEGAKNDFSKMKSHYHKLHLFMSKIIPDTDIPYPANINLENAYHRLKNRDSKHLFKNISDHIDHWVKHYSLFFLYFVEFSLKLGIDPNMMDPKENTLLNKLSKLSTQRDIYGNIAISLLLRSGANPNIPDQEGNTPIFQRNKPEITSLFLEHRANINHQNNLGETALIDACQTTYVDLEPFFNWKADLNIQDRLGKAALHYAFNQPEKVSMLLNHGANPNSIDNEGNTPLHLAAKNKQFETIAILLRQGAKPDLFNRDHKTFLELIENQNMAWIFDTICFKNQSDVKDPIEQDRAS